VNLVYRDEKKKVLFVIGTELKLERFIKEETNVNPENMIIIQTYQPIVSHPFDDLMRDIIIAVYQDNVEEIVVVSTNNYHKITGDILDKIYNNIELQDKIQTLDYLFKNCMPEFSKSTVSLWLNGGENLTDSLQKTVDIMRNHPLLPSHIKVKELYIDQGNEKLSEII
jgi:carbonic anhydrase